MTLCRIGAVAIAVCIAAPAGWADWRSFRGVESAGVEKQPPKDWSDDSVIAWTANLPGRGLASPIVVQGHVIITASSGGRQDKLHVLSFDAATGDLEWERRFWATGRTSGHPKTCNAAPTPTSDGERIFAFYSSNDLVCLDLDGNLQWFRGLTYDYPNASNSLGMSSSPVVIGETVIAVVENDADSFTTGINTITGEERWRLERPRMANWTSPAIWKAPDGKTELALLQSGKGISAIAPLTGEEQWAYGDGASTIASTAVVNGVAFVPSHGMTAIRPGVSTPNKAEILWREGSLNPGTSSPIVQGDQVVVLSDGGVLSAGSSKDGKRKWQSRLKGPFSGSPVVAGNLLYVFNEEGEGFVVDLDNRGKIVSQRSLQDVILCTPAIDDGALYVRSDRKLWKIGAK
jgi:outer membrane protein assembly factor BamB